MDTAGAVTTATSIGSAMAGTVLTWGPYFQLSAWIVATLSGVVAIVLGCIRIRNAWRGKE